MIRVLEKRCVDLHLARQHRPKTLFGFGPDRDLLGTCGQLALGWNHTELLLPRERFLAELVPALIKLALVLVDPFFRHVVRRVCGARREVDEEWLVRADRLLLPDVVDRLIGEILREVIA